MIALVDVLAVMDADRERIAKAYGERMAEFDGVLAPHDAARAAIIEIIAAASAVRDRLLQAGVEPDSSPTLRRLCDALHAAGGDA